MVLQNKRKLNISKGVQRSMMNPNLINKIDNNIFLETMEEQWYIWRKENEYHQ